MDALSDERSGSSTTPLGSELARLRRRMDEFEANDALPPEAAAVLVELEVAYEELRVAHEEVRTQQEEIARLAESQQLARWQHERLLEMLPVPVVTTHESGTVRSANAAAAALIGVPLAHLLRKPLLSYVAMEDRPAVRSGIARLATGTRWSRVVHLVDRTGSPVLVEAAVTAETDGRATWMFMAPTAGGRRRPPGALSLSEALVQVAALGSVELDDTALLQRCASLCQDVLGDRVSLSLNTGPPTAPVALASTSRTAQAIDGTQLALGEGPCVTAFEDGRTVTATDLCADARWSKLGSDPRCRDVGGVVAAPIRLGDELIGALNVYGDVRDPVDEQLVEEVELLSTGIAALFLERSTRVELAMTAADLQRALMSRATIDQAKGIIMADRKCTPDEAFAHLVELSSTQQVKVRDLAQLIVEQRARG